MKKLFLRVTALCVMGLLAGVALAEKEGPEPAGKRKGRRARADRGKQRIENLLDELKLKDDAEAPVRQILETYGQAMRQWTQQNAPALKELRGKLGGGRKPAKPGQQAPEPPKKLSEEEQKEAKAKLRELQQKRAAITENLLKQLKEHLTKEQMGIVQKGLKIRARRPAAPAFWMLKQLDLTAQQREKVQGIMAAAREDAKGKDRKAKGEASRAAMATILKDVLTAEQRDKIEKLKKEGRPRGAGGMFPGIDLTKDQQVKAKEIMTAARAKAKEAGDRQGKTAALREARKKIIEEVLTDEQREKIKQRRQEMREKRKAGRVRKERKDK